MNPKVFTESHNKVQIIGDNILYNNGLITAYYLLPTMNYTTASDASRLSAINDLVHVIENLSNQKETVRFSIEKVDKTMSASDVRRNLYSSIKLYRPDFDMPARFLEAIKSDKQSFTLIGVMIDQDSHIFVEEFTLLETIKSVAKNMRESLVNSITGTPIDITKILAIEKTIFSTISSRCVRASKELVFYNYISKLYPSYQISYDKLSYIRNENLDGILGAAHQTVIDRFGSFIMQNDGVEIFGLDVVETYGCMIHIKEFPLSIPSNNFPMDYPGFSLVVSILQKDKARNKLKRTRGSIEYEYQQALETSGIGNEQLDEAELSIGLADRAISEIERGDLFCEFNCSILVTAQSEDLLKEKVMRLITGLKDRDILGARSINQAQDYYNIYLNSNPRELPHMTQLAFPMSFQLNSGSMVGDEGRNSFAPMIGEDLA